MADITTRLRTPKFRVSFPYVFRPRPGKKPTDDAKFEIVMLFPCKAGSDEFKSMLAEMRAAAGLAVAQKWPDPTTRPKTLRSPFRDGAEKAIDGYDGVTFTRAWSKKRPVLVDGQLLPITDEAAFYAGCWAVATVNAFAYDNDGNRGVSFGLLGIQKVGDGEPFGPSCDPEEDFARIPETALQSAQRGGIVAPATTQTADPPGMF